MRKTEIERIQNDQKTIAKYAPIEIRTKSTVEKYEHDRHSSIATNTLIHVQLTTVRGE